MYKVWLSGGGLVVAAVVGWFIFGAVGPTSVVTFSSAVTALEAELVGVEAAATAGTLSPSAAAAAQTRIATQLEAITTAASEASAVTLTAEQRAQLVAGLAQLRQLLITYQDTLQTVDEQVRTLATTETDAGVVPRGVRLQAVAAIDTVSSQLAVAIDGSVAADEAEVVINSESEAVADTVPEIDATTLESVTVQPTDEETATTSTTSAVLRETSTTTASERD